MLFRRPYKITVAGKNWESSFVVRGFDDYALMVTWLQEQELRGRYSKVLVNKT